MSVPIDGREFKRGFCAYCEKVREGSFCNVCGGKLSKYRDSTAYCTHCKQSQTGKFCQTCGQQLVEQLDLIGKDSRAKYLQEAEFEVLIHPKCNYSKESEISLQLTDHDETIPLQATLMETITCKQEKFVKLKLEGKIPMKNPEEKYIYSHRIKQKIERENRPDDRERTLRKGKGHVHILDGFILPMDPRGLLGFFGIGKLKQEDIILLSQATVVAYLPSIEQLKGELSIGHKFKDIRAQIFQAVYELEHRSFAPFKISVGVAIQRYIEYLCTVDMESPERIFLAILAIHILQEFNAILGETARQVIKSLLHLGEVDGNSCPCWTFLENRTTTSARGQIATSVIKFLEESDQKDIKSLLHDPSWIWSIPLLHLLEGDVTAFQKADEEFNCGSWWGTISFKERKLDQIARERRWTSPYKVVVNKIWNLRHLDAKLLNTFSMCLNLRGLQEMAEQGHIDSALLMANLVRIATTQKEDIYEKDFENCAVYALTLLEDSNANELSKEKGKLKRKRPEANTTRNLELSNMLLKRTEDAHMTLKKFTVFIFLQNIFAEYIVERNVETSERYLKRANTCFKNLLSQMVEPDLKLAVKTVIDCLKYDIVDTSNEMSRSKSVGRFLERMNILKEDLMGFVMEWIQNKVSDIEIVKFICSNDSILLPDPFKSRLRELGKRRLSLLCKTATAEELDTLFRMEKRFCSLYSETLMLIKEQTHPQSSQFVLLSLVTNVCIPAVEKSGKTIAVLSHFDDDASEIITQIGNILNNFLKSLTQGTMQVGNLTHVDKERTSYLNLFRLRTDIEKMFIEQLIETRVIEIHFFENFLLDIHELEQLLNDTELVDTSEFDRMKRDHDDLSTKKISDLVIPISESRIRINDIKPKINVTFLTETMKKYVDRQALMKQCLKSSSFCKLKNKRESDEKSKLVKTKKTKICPNEYISNIWEPCYMEWQKYCNRFADEKITIREIEELFDITMKTGLESRTKAKIGEELELMIGNKGKSEMIETRLQQIDQYYTLLKCVELAERLLRIRTAIDFQSDIGELENIARVKVEKESFQLAMINNRVRDFSEKLKSISPFIIDTLETFLECTDLVNWCRKTMPRGPADLKVFVDLAILSVGDEPMERNKVHCFHTAGLGFAPLIFIPKEISFTQLMRRIKDLEENVTEDVDLNDKLRDSKRNLKWLENVSKSQGRSEETTIAIVSSILKYGIVTVTKPVTQVTDFESHLLISVKAPVEGKKRKRGWKTLLFPEILELQSRLILVGGSSDEERALVEKFLELIENLQRLGTVFANVLGFGCHLFESMTMTFTNNRHKTCTFTLEGVKTELVVTKNNSMSDCIVEFTRVLEGCLKKWIVFIRDERSKNHFLNFFTTKQILILQSELMKISKSSEVDDKVLLPLLSLVNNSCNMEMIRRTFQDRQRLDDGDEGHGASIQETIKDHLRPSMTIDNILEKINELWDTFMKSMMQGESTQMTWRDIGAFLAELSAFAPIARRLQEPFKIGIPNLFICRTTEVIRKVLTLFKLTTEGDTVPHHREILFCRKTTTAEEIDIFLRRATNIKEKGKLHTIMFADELGFDVASDAGRSLKEHTENPTNKEYQIVFVCCSENEENSKIVTELHRYRRNSPMLIQLPILRLYLETILSKMTLVVSNRAGMGKTFNMMQLAKKIQNDDRVVISIPLYQRSLDIHAIVTELQPHWQEYNSSIKRIINFDVYPEVSGGVDDLLFSIGILNVLADHRGNVWIRRPSDTYIVEYRSLNNEVGAVHTMFEMIPKITCLPPETCSKRDVSENEMGFDLNEFRSALYQRPFQYLSRFSKNKLDKTFRFSGTEGTPKECLTILLRYCGMSKPSWSELKQFVLFLNTQLIDYENCVFCSESAMDVLPGFYNFVLKFLILMSTDFSSRSLNLSEESDNSQTSKEQIGDLDVYEMRRSWEKGVHPYLFFNPDRTFTFVGFNIDGLSGSIVDEKSGQIIEERVASSELIKALERNKVPLSEKFSSLNRNALLQKLWTIMGAEAYDPDETYELTADNVKKMLAIYMRFRAGIPVIIMGETGCGKTRLIRFLCQIQCAGKNIQTMIIMKIHGGTTRQEIHEKVETANALAKRNSQQTKRHIFTVLFFDEANTTQHIGLIKEILCDQTFEGHSLGLSSNLKLIAAVNPYRRHSDDVIRRLEQAGLGYHVASEKTNDKLGRLPMRHLVYRVQPLPLSLFSLVFDFGRIDSNTEMQYIEKMASQKLPSQPIRPKSPAGRRGLREMRSMNSMRDVVCKVLQKSQEYMRKDQSECSFVSLRDVERALDVMVWFRHHKITLRLKEKAKEEGNDIITQETRALVLSLGVCYHAALKDKKSYREYIAEEFEEPCALNGGANQFLREITRCQQMILDNCNLKETIAKNNALKENVFMMVICIQLKIPLFLVGKPGSSKSLAKTIVDDAMQGSSSHREFFYDFKQIHMVSFQCSPLATSEGILSAFEEAVRFQEGKSLDNFTSVVVLDEIGLAEDSPKMPLKILHPMLEDGSKEDIQPGIDIENKKVAFLGISNWALDPAKMNRGILVQRDVPDEKELESSARSICSSQQSNALTVLETLISPISTAYLEIFNDPKSRREFFGLRDFYSMVKMLYNIVKKNKKYPKSLELLKAIKRNFGGFDGIDPVEIFQKHLQEIAQVKKNSVTSLELVRMALSEMVPTTSDDESETRYLLLLSESNSLLPMLHEHISTIGNYQTIIGSGFPKDQEYSQICRNINRIKICMEAGKTVILLNLEKLYESLYDVLNQYYVYYGGERYIDLGLGTHRIKCKVHRKFGLIVVAKKHVVYETFPVPLINRLEKHFIQIDALLNENQTEAKNQLVEWMQGFYQLVKNQHLRKRFGTLPQHVFIGYHDDMAAIVVLRVMNMLAAESDIPEVIEKSKDMILWSASPDSVYRLDDTRIGPQGMLWRQKYFKKQTHNGLLQLLRNHNTDNVSLIQVTTFSKLLVDADREDMQADLKMPVMLSHLGSFETEREFCNHFMSFASAHDKGVLIIQSNADLSTTKSIDCCRYRLEQDIYELKKSITVVFVLQLLHSDEGKFSEYQAGKWFSLHMDDVRMDKDMDEQNEQMHRLSFSKYLQEHNSLRTPSERFDFKQLVINCLHLAISKMNDPEEKMYRVLLRVQALLNMFDKAKGDIQFMASVCNHIIRIQALKEVIMGPLKMTRVAAELERVQRAGTFKRSVHKCMEEKISQVLTVLLCFMDTNNNLDFLKPLNKETWQYRLWMGVFQCDKYIASHFKDVGDFSNSNVEQSGWKGQWFKPLFPFSWILFQRIEEIVNAGDEVQDGNILERAEGLLQNEPFANAIVSCSSTSSMKDIIESYTHDFIFQKLLCRNEDECSLFMTAIYKMNIWDTSINILRCLINIHYVYNALEHRMAIINRLIQAESSIVGRVLQDIQQSESNEMISDSVVLLVLLTFLEEQFKNQKHMSAWITLTKKCRYAISKSFHDFQTVTSLGEMGLLNLREARWKWEKILLVYEFYETVLPSESTARVHMRKIWNNVGSRVDMKSQETLKNFKTCIQEVCKNIGGSLQRNKKDVLKKLCNSYFLEAVSSLSFGNGTPPSKDAVSTLMEYVIEQEDTSVTGNLKTKSSLLLDSTDDSPVARSFILQLLLRSRDESVEQYVEKYLNDHRSYFSSRGKQQPVIDLCVMLVHCIEDTLEYHSLKEEYGNVVNPGGALGYLQNTNDLSEEKMTYGVLYCVAKLRFAFSVAAKSLYGYFVQRTECDSKTEAESIQRLLNQINTLCVESIGIVNLKLYFIKTILKAYGETVFHQILYKGSRQNASIDISWLGIGLDQNKVCPDRYIAVGATYQKLKHTLEARIMSVAQDAPQYLQAIQNTKTENLLNCGLALHRLVTFTYINGENNQLYDAIIKRLQNEIRSTSVFPPQIKDLYIELVKNQTWDVLDFFPNESIESQELKSLLIHLFILYNAAPENTGICEPFLNIFRCRQPLPEYLPTMPENVTLSELRQIIYDGSSAQIYMCPNNHPYVITECGRPWVTSNCPIPGCGAVIGGTSHTAAKGNRKMTEKEIQALDKGHSLGEAMQIDDQASAVRNLSSTSCAILRFYLHATMLLACKENRNIPILKGICKTNTQSFPDFLLKHVQNDLKRIQRVLDLNFDDVMTLLHRLNFSMLASFIQTYRGNSGLRSKDERQKWENDFEKDVLDPIILVHDQVLRGIKTDMKKEHKVFEESTKKERHIEIDKLHRTDRLWKYRKQISVQSFKLSFQIMAAEEIIKEGKYSLLKEYFNCMHSLHGIRFLPHIFSLQRDLLHRFNRKATKDYLDTTKFSSLVQAISSETERDQLTSDVNRFLAAWREMRHQLADYPLVIKKNENSAVTTIVFPRDMCNTEITDESPLSVFLPSYVGLGLYSFALTHFLLSQQNSFLEKYCNIHGHSYSDWPIKLPGKATPADIIVIDETRDVLPLIIAHSHYTVSDNGKTAEFDFEGFERHLKRQYIDAKPKFDTKQIPVIRYTSERTEISMFSLLRERVPQVPLSASQASILAEEYRTIPEICACLDHLDISIKFLHAASPDPAENLYKFMTDTLRFEIDSFGEQTRQICSIKHTQCFWILLMMWKAKKQASINQDPFEILNDTYKIGITKAHSKMLKNHVNSLPKDKKASLEHILFESIMFIIGDEDEDQDFHELKLRDVLCGYIDAPRYSSNLLEEEESDIGTPAYGLEDCWQFPEEIMGNQCVNAWKTIILTKN